MREKVFGVIAALSLAMLFACNPALDAANKNSAPPPCTAIGQQWVSPIDGVTLQCVPAGEFTMGARADDSLAPEDSKPQHQVYLDALWIDRTEAPNANFQKCVDAGKCKPRPTLRGATGVASTKHLNYYYDTSVWRAELDGKCLGMGRGLVCGGLFRALTAKKSNRTRDR